MKREEHPLNLPVRVWIGLLMCALDQGNGAPPAALHSTPGLGWQENSPPK